MLGIQLHRLGHVISARQPTHLPVVLTVEESRAIPARFGGSIDKRSINTQHNLPHRMPGLDLAMGFNGLFERQHPTDVQPQSAGVDEFTALAQDVDLMLTSGGQSAQLRGQHQFEADAQVAETGLGQWDISGIEQGDEVAEMRGAADAAGEDVRPDHFGHYVGALPSVSRLTSATKSCSR